MAKKQPIEETVVPEMKPVISVDEACRAYGIEPKYLLASRVDGDTVMLITVGGSKVVWSYDKDVKPLSRIQVTGINPANANKKPITGGKR